MNIKSKIYIAGHNGMVGSAIKRQLEEKNYENLLTVDRKELDLLDPIATARFFEKNKPEYIFMAAAKVGGIIANNKYPADFIYENLQIQNNVIHNAYLTGVKKLLFLGSTCIYPRDVPQPMKETALLTGKLEPTNEPYAISKIAGIKMCQSYNRQYGTNFIACMPTNLYGPNDNFDLETSHVIPAIMRKIHEAKKANSPKVTIWGTGTPKREFLHVDDMANACVYMMDQFNPTDNQNESGDMFLNIGYGEDISILDLTVLMADIIGYKGKIVKDTSKPDGTPRKLVDSNRLFKLGWKPTITLRKGLELTYKWFLANNSND